MLSCCHDNKGSQQKLLLCCVLSLIEESSLNASDRLWTCSSFLGKCTIVNYFKVQLFQMYLLMKKIHLLDCLWIIKSKTGAKITVKHLKFD